MHRFLPAHDRFDRRERLREPVAQAARAHRGDGAVERAVKRGRTRGVAVQRVEDFQVPLRGAVEIQVVRPLIARADREMRHIAAQMLREVMQHAARRADGRRLVLETEAVE